MYMRTYELLLLVAVALLALLAVQMYGYEMYYLFVALVS
jgi:hypothetical protein